jgi:hypothetical protein
VARRRRVRVQDRGRADPEKHVGFSIEINSEDGEIINGLLFELLDHYLGAPANDWPAKFRAYTKERIEKGVQAMNQTAAKPARVGPSLKLDRYVGTYTDKWYGDIEVALVKGALTIDFKSTPRMGGASSTGSTTASSPASRTRPSSPPT